MTGDPLADAAAGYELEDVPGWVILLDGGDLPTTAWRGGPGWETVMHRSPGDDHASPAYGVKWWPTRAAADAARKARLGSRQGLKAVRASEAIARWQTEHPDEPVGPAPG